VKKTQARVTGKKAREKLKPREGKPAIGPDLREFATELKRSLG